MAGASSPSRVADPGLDGNLNDLGIKSMRVNGADSSVAQATTTVGDWGYNAISTATTTTVKSGAGQVGAILVLGGTMGAITVYDNTAASGTVIVPAFTPVTPTGSGPNVTVLNCAFSTGLTIVTATAMQIVVLYR